MGYLILYLLIVWAIASPVFLYAACLRIRLLKRLEGLFVSFYCTLVLLVYFIVMGSFAGAMLLVVFAAGPICFIAYRGLKATPPQQ